MKEKRNSKSAVFNLRISAAAVFCLAGIVAVVLAVIAIDPANGNWATGAGKAAPGGGSPTPTPTATPVSCSWLAARALSRVGPRFVGVFFPGNFHHSRNSVGGHSSAVPEPTVSPPPLGKFLTMGGSSSDTPGSEFTHPFQYDPASNTWTTKSATYPDNQVNNMACGVLN